MTPDALFDYAELFRPEPDPDLSIQERFDRWCDLNPWVMVALERLVQRWLEAGHSRVGIKQMWEVIRFEYGATTGDTFKANNDFTSRAARRLIEMHPEWADAIETRVLRAA